MNISLLDVVGPIMIGPSSSHTAGAAKLARTAAMIFATPFKKVIFELGGSFASTYKGHFTDRALVAGILGMREDDENLEHSFSVAKEQGLSYEFVEGVIESPYENTLRIIFPEDEGFFIEGASLGGGRILITNINGMECEFSATSTTVIIRQQDVKGVIGDIATILAFNDVNIATMKVSRSRRGDAAYCVIECDQPVGDKLKESLERVNNVKAVVVVNIEEV